MEIRLHLENKAVYTYKLNKLRTQNKIQSSHKTMAG